jgi:fermentation-respiration switch protein FrsA (DUF1100 family)
LEQVRKSKTPILFIYGVEDAFVPVEMVYKLYEAAQCEKELWVVTGAEHGRSYDIAEEKYQTKMSEFYSKYMN